MVLYNARPIFGVFPSFPPASAQGKEGSTHKNMMTVKGYLISNSTRLQYIFILISNEKNDNCKKDDVPLSLSHRPKNKTSTKQNKNANIR